MFYVIMNRDLYLHRNEEEYTMDYENAAQFATAKDAEHMASYGCKVVGPCKEGEEP